MQLKTSKGNEYEAVLCYAPTYDDGCMIEIRDSRLLSEIAPEFEGLDWVEINELKPTKYYNYKELKLLSKAEDVVQIKLYKR